MTELDLLYGRLVSTWRGELATDKSRECFFRITEDFRFLCFSAERRDPRWGMMADRLWILRESDSVFRFKYTWKNAVFLRRFHFEGDELVIDRVDPPLVSRRCQRLAKSDLPEWFEGEFHRRPPHRGILLVATSRSATITPPSPMFGPFPMATEHDHAFENRDGQLIVTTGPNNFHEVSVWEREDAARVSFAFDIVGVWKDSRVLVPFDGEIGCED